jgi:hypothetical protein
VSAPHRFRWLAVGAFDIRDGEAVCVDYRVMLLPDGASVRQVRDATVAAKDCSMTQVPEGMGIPGGGLPLAVLREASPARLAAKATAKVGERKARGADVSRALEQFAGAGKPKPGRPPVMSLADKLQVLQRIDEAFTNGETLETVARDMYLSRSSVRDLLSWARHDANPALFTKAGPGKRGGRLTPEAKALIQKLGEEG